MFNMSSAWLLVKGNWCIFPSRTRPLQTSSSASTARGRWLKWACFFTPLSASSTGRLSGSLFLLPWKKKPLILDRDPLLLFYYRHLEHFSLWLCLQVWFLCKSSDQNSPSSQSGSSLWQGQNAWRERSRGHSRHAGRWTWNRNNSDDIMQYMQQLSLHIQK